MGVPGTGLNAVHVSHDRPPPRVEVEAYQVVAILHSIVAAEDVHDVLMHHRRGEHARPRRWRGELYGLPLPHRVALIASGCVGPDQRVVAFSLPVCRCRGNARDPSTATSVDDKSPFTPFVCR